MENSKCSEEESKKYILGLLRNGLNSLEGKVIDEPPVMGGLSLQIDVSVKNKKIPINNILKVNGKIVKNSIVSVNRDRRRAPRRGSRGFGASVRGGAYAWEKYQSKKYSGKMLTRLLIFSVGSYLKLPEFNHIEELSDDIVNIYINDNRLYDFFKDKELLGYGDVKNLSEICNFQKVIMFGLNFLKGRAPVENDKKEDIPLLMLEIIKNNINDKNLIVNIVINAMICFFITIGAFKDKNADDTKKIILAIRRTLLKLNDVKIQEYLKYLFIKSGSIGMLGEIFSSVDELSVNMIKQEDKKICNILRESGFTKPSYDGEKIIINMGGDIIKFSVDQAVHISINKKLKVKDYKKNLSIIDFGYMEKGAKMFFYEKFRKLKSREDKLNVDMKMIFNFMELIHCSMQLSDKKGDEVEKENYCGENTEWNENTQKCDFKLTEDVCDDDTRWNEETQKCESNPSDDICGENTKWSSIKGKCVISKNVCGKDTFLSPKTDQCESDGMCNIM
jgi:hypothetical protein